MLDLTNKVVLITGCSRGLGPHIAQAFSRAGAHLAITARSAAPLEALAQTLRAQGTRVSVIPADIADPKTHDTLYQRTVQELGGLHVLVNNAGLESEGAFADITPQAIAETVTVNVIAPMQLTSCVLPHLLRQKQGQIINLSSTAGKKGAAYDAVYSGTKAALVNWSAGLRAELAPANIGVSVICPGYVTETGMFARFGIKPPAIIGSTTPQTVAAAIVRAAQRNPAEVIVNSMPIRPLLALDALSPRFGNWFLKAIGLVAMQRHKADLSKQGKLER